MWRYLLAAVITLVLMVAFLFSPRVPPGKEDANCVSVMDVGPAHIHKNCDSEEFQYIAADPGLMVSERPTRQNRPLYAVMGWVFARPFHWLGLQSIGRRAVQGMEQTYPKGPAPAAFFPEYAGFVALNFVLLMTAILAFFRLSRAQSLLDPITLLPLSMLVVNQVTKAFFWTPHLQIFNVLIPLVSVAIYMSMIRNARDLTWWRTGLLGLAIGIGALAYGAFAVTAAGGAICIVVGDRWRGFGKELVTRVMKAGFLLLAFLIPTAAWTWYVIQQSGSFYSQEIDLFRQVVWMYDALSAGGVPLFLNELSIRSEDYVETLVTVALFPAIVIALLELLIRLGRAPQIAKSEDRWMLRAIALYIVANVAFFWLLGYYETRLTWTVVPALALLIAVRMRALDGTLAGKSRWLLRAGSIGVALAWITYWYTSAGPWA